MPDVQKQLKELQEASEYNLNIMQNMIEVQKHTLDSTVATGANAHGVGGLFSGIGVRPDMYATVPRPINEFSSLLPLISSNMNNEIYEILTGQTDLEGDAAADSCSDGPIAGQFKVCRQQIPFGKAKMSTPVRHGDDLGTRIDYADMDRNVLNLDTSPSRFMPAIPGMNVNSDTGKLIMQFGRQIEKSVVLCDGQGVAGNTSNIGSFAFWMSQYDGIERVVRTGYTDSVTTVACPAADSVVISHRANIGSVSADNGQAFTTNVVDMVYSVKQRAETFGITPFTGAIVVHPNMKRALFYHWACAYYTDFCAGSQYNENNTDAVMIRKFADEMMNGSYLLVDGMPIPVFVHSGLSMEATGTADEYMADVFYLPIAWGNRALMFYHYFPQGNPDSQAWYNLADPGAIRIYNNGLYRGYGNRSGGCMNFSAEMKMRLILDTPFLAGRVNDVEFSYLAQTRDARPEMSFYRDGGQSGRLQRI